MGFLKKLFRPVTKVFKAIVKPFSSILGDVISWLIPMPDMPDLDSQARGSLVNKQSNIEQVPVIYGERRVGGTIVFVETSGSNNTYLYMCLILAEGEVDNIGDIYIDDVLLEVGSVHYPHVLIDKKVGTDAQTASTVLTAAPSWGATDTLNGIAYLGIRLTYNQDVFTSIPTINAVVRGRKVYDPRTTNTAYSNNPALCLRDYLTNDRYGKGLPVLAIDDTTFSQAANDCDVVVDSYDGGPSVKAFSCNAVLQTSASLFANVKIILSGMQGLMPYQNGQYRIFVEKDKASTFDFTIDNVIGGISITGVSKSSKYNKVVAKFINPDANWQPDSVIWPEADSTESITYLSEDNGVELSVEQNLTTVTSYYQARNIAKTAVLASRLAGISVSLIATSEALNCAVGDVVTVTHPTPGWQDKKFRVSRLSLNYNGTVSVALAEHVAAVYPWVNDKEQPASAQSTLPNPFQVSAPTDLGIVAANNLTPDGATQSGLLITWTPPVNSFVTQYEVQYIRGASNFDWGSIADSSTESINYGSITTSADSSADYGSISDATATGEAQYNTQFVTTPYFVIPTAVAGAEYAVRVRAINSFGVRSSFITSNETTYGDETAPNVPSEITANGGYKEITLTWVNPTVSDFDYVEVYRAQTNSVSSSTRVGVLRGSKFVDTGLGINVTRYYWLKSVDRTGNKSDFSSPVSATTAFIDSDSFSQEVLNLFSEAGAYGIEPVATLPAAGDFDGQIKYDTTLNKLYRWDATAVAWTDDIFSITSGSVDEASFAAGIEPVKIVAELPNTSGYTGAKVVFLTTDNKLYRYDGAAWVTGVAAADINGTLASSNFAQDLRPVEIVSALPSTGNFQGRVVVLTSDNKLYRYTGTAWTAAVPTTDLSGTISAAQIASVAAASVTGTLTNSQIADLATAKLTGTITGTQITDGAISTAKLAAGSVSASKIIAGAVTADALSANSVTSAAILSGAITTAKLAAGSVDANALSANSVTASKILAGAVTSDAIDSNSITTAKLAAGAVTADILSANSVTADKILAGAVTADALSANSVVAGKVATAAISTDQLSANAVTSAKIATNAITADKILAGSIQTDKIAANAITGGLIAASGVITTAAQIDDAIITNAKIANGAITTAKIDDAQITTAKIGDLQVNTAKIANESVSVISSYDQDVTNSTSFYSTFSYSMPNAGAATFLVSILPLGSYTSSSVMTNSFRENDPFATPFQILSSTNLLAGSIKTYCYKITHATSGVGFQTSCQTILTNVGYNASGQRGAFMRWILIRTYK